jgi:hypothetical protein
MEARKKREKRGKRKRNNRTTGLRKLREGEGAKGTFIRARNGRSSRGAAA